MLKHLKKWNSDRPTVDFDTVKLRTMMLRLDKILKRFITVQDALYWSWEISAPWDLDSDWNHKHLDSDL